MITERNNRSLSQKHAFTGLKLWPTLFLLTIVFCLLSTKVYADRMTSDNYEFIFGNINFGGNEQTSNNYTLDISLGQTVAERFNSTNYLVRAGFQYIHILYPFSFTLSDTSLDLGTLIPSTPSTQGLTATISNRGQGYEVKVIEDHALRTLDASATIPDTSCNGSPACTTTSAQVWNSSSAYGFGYNANGDDVSSDFVDATYYRPFSSVDAKTFMSSNQIALNRQSTVTVKVNISNIQEAGTYQTVLKFIAVPKY